MLCLTEHAFVLNVWGPLRDAETSYRPCETRQAWPLSCKTLACCSAAHPVHPDAQLPTVWLAGQANELEIKIDKEINMLKAAVEV